MLKESVTLNLKVNKYSNSVLGVIKEKYGLKDKSQALNRFIDLFGDEFVDRDVKENVIRDVIKEVEYLKKSKSKPLTSKDIDKLCGL